MKKIFSLFAAVLFAGSMMADVANFDWRSGGNMTTATGTQGFITLSVAGNDANTPAVTSNTLRLYAKRTTGNGASATFTAASGYQITAFTVNCPNGSGVLRYGIDDDSPSSSFTSWTNDSSTIDNLTASSFTLKNCQNSGSSNTTIQIAYVTVTYESTGGTPTCGTPTITPNGGTFYISQSVKIECATDGATIHYTIDGTNPTASSETYSAPFAITSTTTVKAIAVKEGANNSEIASATFTKGEPITSFDIDFEKNDLPAYINWEFENIAIVSTPITAHGGTYYGNTKGKASATITTKEKFANPGTLTFWTSKESGNTTASSWKVQVSSDGSAWTDVATFDATTGAAGEWTERSAILNTYSNVYVRISYGSSTAIRAIDDISLEEASLEPTVAVSPSVLDLGSAEQGANRESLTKKFTLTGVNLTNELILSSSGTDAVAFDVSIYVNPETDGTIDLEVGVFPFSTDEIGSFNGAVTLKGTGANPDGIDTVLVTVSWTITAPVVKSNYKKTALANIKDDDEVIVTMRNTTSNDIFALSSANGSSSNPSAIDLTASLSNDTILTGVEDIYWNIAQSKDTLILYVNGSTTTWLYCTSSGPRVGNNSAKTWVVEQDANSNDYLKHVGTDRYIGVYNSNDWRGYTTIHANIAGEALEFYVKVKGAPTAVENTNVTEKAVKVIENGQIFIIKNGVKYNVMGAIVK